jgi:hypothetical protein
LRKESAETVKAVKEMLQEIFYEHFAKVKPNRAHEVVTALETWW